MVKFPKSWERAEVLLHIRFQYTATTILSLDEIYHCGKITETNSFSHATKSVKILKSEQARTDWLMRLESTYF